MNLNEVIISIIIMTSICSVVALLLAFASRKLSVKEDPRIDIVETMLPGANCGACGVPGCRAFSEAVVGGKAKPSSCTVSTAEGHKQIAKYLGIDAGTAIKRVARLACAGGSNVSKKIAQYSGFSSCQAASAVSGGGQQCSWGCIGLGDCADVCDFDAIFLNEHHLPIVIESKCTACGDCVDICPKNLFSIHPVDHQLWVACKSLINGDEALEACRVACTGCGICAKDSEKGVIKIEEGLAIVNYDLNGKTSKKATLNCPTSAIQWLNQDEGDRKALLYKEKQLL